MENREEICMVLKVEVDNVALPFYQIYRLPKGRLIRLEYGANIPGLMQDELYDEEFNIGYFYEADGCAGFLPLSPGEEAVRKVDSSFSFRYEDVKISVVKVSGPGYRGGGRKKTM